jgi:hypothetical protein
MGLKPTQAQFEEAMRKTLTPWTVSLYQATPTTGISLTATTDNKISIVVAPPTGIIPNGFDLYVTPQGPATRFIGSGLGNGDTFIGKATIHMSLESTASAGNFTFKLKTRPYTETDFANATQIEGCFASADVENNLEDEYVIVAPLVKLSDGDLVELAIYPDGNETIDINALAVTLIEIN